jgi:hypothetical protein
MNETRRPHLGLALGALPDVLAACMDIVLVRIARSRMAGEPPAGMNGGA